MKTKLWKYCKYKQDRFLQVRRFVTGTFLQNNQSRYNKEKTCRKGVEVQELGLFSLKSAEGKDCSLVVNTSVEIIKTGQKYSSSKSRDKGFSPQQCWKCGGGLG